MPRPSLEIELTKPQLAYQYAAQHVEGRAPLVEGVIATSAEYSLKYALHIVRGRWPEGETVIASHASSAFCYAHDVLRGRWPEAEATIAAEPHAAGAYACHVIGGRWPEAEAVIATNADAACSYARHVIEGRWPKAEALIARDDHSAYKYESFMARIGVKLPGDWKEQSQGNGKAAAPTPVVSSPRDISRDILNEAVMSAFSESGFYYQEGGCFGAALALRDIFRAKGLGEAALMVSEDWVHAWVRCNGTDYDSEGEGIAGGMMSKFDAGSEVTEEAFCAKVAKAGWDREEVESDRDAAHELLAAAFDRLEVSQPLPINP